MIVELDTPRAGRKVIAIEKFAAMDGWDIQARFSRFAASTSAELRRDFTLEVLRYAKVVQSNGGTLPLTTDALISNHIGSWENIKLLFEEILSYNGIDPQKHAWTRQHYWVFAGSEMAAGFFTALVEPVAEIMKDNKWTTSQ